MTITRRRTAILNMKFALNKVPESFLHEAPWIFRAELDLSISIEDCWSILQDDEAWQDWHPEVTNIVWDSDLRDVGASRSIVFKDTLFMILLAGPTKLYEKFDIWQETDEIKRMSFRALDAAGVATVRSPAELGSRMLELMSG